MAFGGLDLFFYDSSRFLSFLRFLLKLLLLLKLGSSNVPLSTAICTDRARALFSVPTKLVTFPGFPALPTIGEEVKNMNICRV